MISNLYLREESASWQLVMPSNQQPLHDPQLRSDRHRTQGRLYHHLHLHTEDLIFIRKESS